MLRDEDKKEIGKRLAAMEGPVKLIYFTQETAGECQYCVETGQLLKELSELSDKLSLDVLNFVIDKEKVGQYQIDKIPATVIEGKKDQNLRFYGIPSGYEFASFLEAILLVSRGESGLADDIEKEVKSINEPVHIQVFVTPTCPYCQQAALTSYAMALANDNIRSDIVEVSEFMHLGQKYGVMGVPKVVINETHSFEGALPENLFLEEVRKASQKKAK